MLRNAWRAVTILLKGAGMLAAIAAILFVVGLIWLTVNPPFATPTTGKLHASTVRDLTIAAGQTTVAVQLEAKLNDNAMRMPNGQPGPPTLKAAITGTQTGSTEGVRLSLAPGDTTGPSSIVRETAPGQLAWAMPCLDGPGRPCRQLVLLLVEAPPSTTDRTLRLAVNGDLQYPTFVPTPGWSSFDLGLRPVGAQEGTGPNPVAEAAGTVDLAMERPVVVVPVHVEYGAAPAAVAGTPQATLRLELQTERLTETSPAGLDAPEPVRATVIGADGTVVARLGVRPGEAPTLSFALGPCASTCVRDDRIAFEWMDRRPEADYRLTWRAEVIGLPADDRAAVPVAIRAGEPEVAEPVATTLAPGPDAGPLRAQQLGVAIGGLPPAGVASNPIHVQMLIRATVDPAVEIGADVVRIEPFPVAGRGGLRIPFDVEPGGTGAIVMNLEDGCDGKRCDSWSFLASIPTRSSASPSAALQVAWQLDVRAWRLVPDPAPMTLALDVR